MKAKHGSRSAVLAGLALGAALLFTGCGTSQRDARVYFTNTTVNDRAAHMILDTGSDQTRLFGSSARRLEVKTALSAPRTGGHDVDAMSGLSEAVRIRTGTQTLTNQLSVVNPPWYMLFGLPGVDGLVSWREVRDNILVFDVAHRTVSAVETLPEGITNWLKLGIRPGNQLWFDEPQPDGKPGEMLLDTGDSMGIALPPDRWTEWRKVHTNTPVITKHVGSIAGTGKSREAWADEFRLGSLTLTDVPVRSATSPELTLNSSDYAGTIGLYALSRMDLVLDGKHGAAYLRPKAPPGPFYAKFKRPGMKADTNQPADKQGDWTIADNVRLDEASLRAEGAVAAAIARLARRDFKGAVGDFSRALELDPDNVGYHLERAAASSQAGSYSSAIADCTRALELDPRNLEALEARSQLRLEKADFDGAVADTTRLIELGDQAKEVYLLRGAAELNQADYPATIADCNRVLELDPRNADACIARGEARVDEGDSGGGLADFNQALKLNPRNVRGWNARASARLGEDDFNGGIADLDRAIKLDPKNADLVAERGFARFNHGDSAAAREDMARALKLNAGSPYVQMLTGATLEIGGNFAAATVCYEAAIKLQPEASPNSRIHRQLLRRRLGLPAEDFSAVVNGWKESWFKTEGRFVAGQTSEAEFLLAAKTTSPRELCEAAYFAGMMRLVNGDSAGAREQWQKCLATGFRASREYYFARAELGRLDAGAAK